MKPLTKFGYFRLNYFSKPVADRAIYRLIGANKVSSIIEFGLGTGQRAEKMIQVALKFGIAENVRYTGIDLFEGRSAESPGLSLKEFHKRLKQFTVKTQAVPGTPLASVMRIANSHLRTDLILISADYSLAEFEECWFYFPRMLHAKSIVMVQSEVDGPFKSLNRLEIEKKAEQAKKRAAA